MPTNQQADDLRAVLCECEHAVPHPLGSNGCTVTVKPGTYGSWKPMPIGGWLSPRYPVADIYAELAKHAPDKATRKRYRFQAATTRHAARY